jgi:hypothetical protein
MLSPDLLIIGLSVAAGIALAAAGAAIMKSRAAQAVEASIEDKMSDNLEKAVEFFSNTDSEQRAIEAAHTSMARKSKRLAKAASMLQAKVAQPPVAPQ